MLFSVYFHAAQITVDYSISHNFARHSFHVGLRSIYFGGNMLIVTFLLSGIFYNFVFVAYSSSELSFSKNKLLSVKQ